MNTEPWQSDGAMDPAPYVQAAVKSWTCPEYLKKPSKSELKPVLFLDGSDDEPPKPVSTDPPPPGPVEVVAEPAKVETVQVTKADGVPVEVVKPAETAPAPVQAVEVVPAAEAKKEASYSIST